MDIKTQKMLADVVLNAQKKSVQPYTTTAKVKSVADDTVYVEIPGSDRITPVKSSSVAVKKGDIVDLAVSHSDTHITGNRSDIATPQSSTKELSQAMEANRLELNNKLDLANNKIKMVGNDIEMIDNTITQQGNTITEINNTIDSQNNTITQQGNKIVEVNNAVTEVNNKVESQNNTITQIGNTVDQQNNTITEMNNKIDSQNNIIKEMDDTITSQGNTITQLDNKVTSQGNTITQQGNTITEMNSAIETLDSTVKTQGSSIETLDSSVKIIDSAFVIQNGKLTGISEILTKILDSDYVTTDLLNADVAWIEDGKIKEGAIGTAEIHDTSITTAKIAELSADVIKTGTLKTECLILTTDEIDPKTGEKKVALITALNAKTKAGEGNILDGAVIKDETVEAAKIKVVDLEAFGATIGNFHIGTSSIHNNKTALTDPTDGVYIGTDGIALGQGSLLNMTDDSPFRVESDGDFHLGGKNSNYVNFNAFSGKLDINAESIKMGSSNLASQSYVDQKADGIAMVVSEKVGANEIISKINQTAEIITIDASKLNLNGYVTIKNLKDSGATEINGANIISGSIDANKLNVVDLSALNATIGGFNIIETGISKTYNKDSSIISGKQNIYELILSSDGAPYFRSAKHEWKVADYVYNKELTCDGDLTIEYNSRYGMNGSIANRQTIELKADWSYPGLYITGFTKSGTQKSYRTIYRDTGFGRWKYTNGIEDGTNPMYCSSPFGIGSDRNASLTNFDLRVSSSDGNHMNLGQRTIQAVNKDDAATTLYLNSYGGSVSIGRVGGAGTTTLNANVSFEKNCSNVTTTSPNNSVLYGILMNGGQFVAIVFHDYPIHSVDPWGVIVQENLMPVNSNAKDIVLWHNLTTGRGEAVRVAFNPRTGNLAVNAQYNTLTNDHLNGIAIFPVLQ